MCPEQQLLDLGAADVRRSDQTTERQTVKPPKLPEAPHPIQQTLHLLTIGGMLDAEAMQQPEPAEERMPRPGDEVEMLWAKGWPKLGWVKGQLVEWSDPRQGLTVRIQDPRVPSGAIWSAHLYRRDEARNRRFFGTPGCGEAIWRWPKGA